LKQKKKPAPPFPKQQMHEPGLEEDLSPKPQFEAEKYRPAGKLRNKVALITGGDSGIGRAVAIMFAREGADVALVYLEVEQPDAETTQSAVESEGRTALLLPGDVRDAAFCDEAVSKTIEKFGALHILVNNAAYQKHRDGLLSISPEQWDQTFRTNIYGYFYMTRSALPHLKPGACVINTGSVTGLEGSKRLLDYAATKGAIHAFTKSLAQNLVDKGIRVNGVAPGPVWTPLNPAERSADEIRDFGSDTPMGRPAQPDEIAPAYVFLASNADTAFLSGHILPLLGGDTIAG
jgi:NAD(P)-dependent dehydrogenase (short-subunit alcohol dehydrogenase family)